MRLNKFLAERLGWSRRKADAEIAAGRLTVNGKTGIIGQKVDKNDKVCYNGKVVPVTAHFCYLKFYKPPGYVCSRSAQGAGPTIYQLLPKKYQNLKTVGRLDKDSSGLILLTNDGNWGFRMTHPQFQKTKIYEVLLDRELTAEAQRKINASKVEIGDGVSRMQVTRKKAKGRRIASESGAKNGRPAQTTAKVGKTDAATAPPAVDKTYTVTMQEGRNRQIRRTFGALGYTVRKLHRVRFGDFELGSLGVGEYEEVQRPGGAS